MSRINVEERAGKILDHNEIKIAPTPDGSLLKDLITEKQSIWESLQQAVKPVVLYGMGDGAEKILNACREFKIPVSGIFASDEFVRGQFFRGFQVETYAGIRSRLGEFIVLLSFATALPELLARIEHIASEQELYAPDVPLYQEPLFLPDAVEENLDELEAVYAMLEDEWSRKVFVNTIQFKISGRTRYLNEITTPKEEVYSSILHVGTDETYVDVGAYDGDTIREFLKATGQCFRQIHAIEPDPKNYTKLEQSMQLVKGGPVCLYHTGAWNQDSTLSFHGKAGRNSYIEPSGKQELQVRRLDTLLEGVTPTLIKMDVEGAEKEAVEGAEKLIQNHHPALILSAYHRNHDFYRLALQIKKINPDYKLFLRHHPYLPAWETNLYCIANK